MTANELQMFVLCIDAVQFVFYGRMSPIAMPNKRKTVEACLSAHRLYMKKLNNLGLLWC